jgi:hypothetical protein
VSIVDFARTSPSIDPSAFPDTPADSFWTATPVADGPGEAWYVNFATGFDYPGHEDFLMARVRCVSGPAGAPGARLSWTRDTSAPVSWAGAGTYCAGLGLAGGGWRLPAVKELIALVDFSRADPAIDLAAFPNATSDPLWSASPSADVASQAWMVDFSDGEANTIDAATTLRARCVR